MDQVSVPARYNDPMTRPPDAPRTIKEIAAVAGVSKSTVSRVLNDTPGVSPKARELVRTAIEDRLLRGAAPARYRLEVTLDDRIEGFGIRGDNAVTRERRTLRARYRLVEVGAGTVVLDQTAGSDVGIDVVDSQYATIAAEQTALERLSIELADQIVTRVALFASRMQEKPTRAAR